MATETPMMPFWEMDVRMVSPDTAETTEIAGVSTPSPMTCVGEVLRRQYRLCSQRRMDLRSSDQISLPTNPMQP